MRTIDGIEEIGRSLRHGSGANEQYELLEEAAQCGTSRPISELGWPTWGYLRRLNADERRQLGVDAQTEAILSWTDGDENDAATGIQLLTSAEADELEAEFTGPIVERIIEHYRKHPEDDGHAAYALWRMRNQRLAEAGRSETDREHTGGTAGAPG